MQDFQIEEQVLKVTNDNGPSRGRGGKGAFRGGCNKAGHGRGRQSLNKSLIECFKCHKMGHFQYECPNWERQAHYAELDEEDEELLLVAYEELHHTTHEDVWFLDSGCSNHMTGSKEWFIDLEEGLCKTVKLGNNTTMTVVGKGSIRVKINGFTQVISDVYFVPELKNNLLSLGQLQEKGLSILIQQGSCKIFHPEKSLIMHSKMKGNRMFYVTALAASKESMCVQTNTSFDQETHLWHCRFGHLSYKGLNTLASKEMVTRLPSLKFQNRIL